jgi:hypothetical protein
VTDGSHNLTEWKWTPQREKAAFVLATAKNITEASDTCGVSRQSLYLWMKRPEFMARVQEHLDENIAEARRHLQRNAAFAAQRMVDFAFNASSEHSVRLAAAKDILDRVGLKAPEKLEHGGPGGGPLRIVWAEDGSDSAD